MYSKEMLENMRKDELIDLASVLDIELSWYDKGRKERIVDKIIDHLQFANSEFVDDNIRVSIRPATAEEMEVKRDTEIQAAQEVAIVSLWPAKIRVRDAPSGRTYVWPRAGTTVMVATEDVEYVMSRNHSEARGCCGTRRKRVYFEYA